MVVAQWNIPLQLDFPREVVGVFSKLTAIEPKEVQGMQVHLGPFRSTLKLFRTAEFQAERAIAVFQATELAFVEQHLMGDSLNFSFLGAWLSNSSAPEAPAIHTLDAVALQEGPGVVRIRTQLRVCPDS